MKPWVKLPHDGELLILADRGYSPAMIAAAFGCTPEAVRKRFRVIGIEPGKPVPRPPHRRPATLAADFLPAPVRVTRTVISKSGTLYRVAMSLPRISMHVKVLEARHG